MGTEPMEAFNSDEISAKWASLSEEEKRSLFEKSSPDVLQAFVDFIRSIGKSNEKLLDLHADEIAIYKELLSREEIPQDERQKILDCMNEAIDKNRDERIGEQAIKKGIVRTASGIAVIAAGSFLYNKVDKKLGGSVVLIGAGITAGKIPKALKDAFKETFFESDSDEFVDV